MPSDVDVALCPACGESGHDMDVCINKLNERGVRHAEPHGSMTAISELWPLLPTPERRARLASVLARCRVRGFRPLLTPASNLAAYSRAIAEETASVQDLVTLDGAQNRLRIEMQRLREHMAKLKPQQQKENTLMAKDNNPTPSVYVQGTGEMIKDAMLNGSINAACKKTNQIASDFLAGLLRDKAPIVDTPEGKLALQVVGPGLLHFLCAMFPEHVPGAAKIAPLLSRAETMAMTDGVLMVGDKLGDIALPALKQAAAQMSEVFDKLPAGATERLKEDEENRVRAQALNAQLRAAEHNNKTL